MIGMDGDEDKLLGQLIDVLRPSNDVYIVQDSDKRTPYPSLKVCS